MVDQVGNVSVANLANTAINSVLAMVWLEALIAVRFTKSHIFMGNELFEGVEVLGEGFPV